jgi:hypothetical protein
VKGGKLWKEGQYDREKRYYKVTIGSGSLGSLKGPSHEIRSA